MNTPEREELPELPEPRIVSYQVDSTMRRTELRTYDESDMRAYGRLCRAGREDAFDPSHPWPGVDSVLVSAFACGENDLEFDMIQARRVINEAFLRRLSPQAGGSDE